MTIAMAMEEMYIQMENLMMGSGWKADGMVWAKTFGQVVNHMTGSGNMINVMALEQ